LFPAYLTERRVGEMAPVPARKLQDPEFCVTLEDKPLSAPELLYSPRRMTGLFNTLTPEQKKRAVEYCGEESFGDLEFARK
jgi:hypothetical protein